MRPRILLNKYLLNESISKLPTKISDINYKAADHGSYDLEERDKLYIFQVLAALTQPGSDVEIRKSHFLFQIQLLTMPPIHSGPTKVSRH